MQSTHTYIVPSTGLEHDVYLRLINSLSLFLMGHGHEGQPSSDFNIP